MPIVLLPKLPLKPLPTGPARNMVRNALEISPVDHFSVYLVTISGHHRTANFMQKCRRLATNHMLADVGVPAGLLGASSAVPSGTP